jgi:hypothetical protein
MIFFLKHASLLLKFYDSGRLTRPLQVDKETILKQLDTFRWNFANAHLSQVRLKLGSLHLESQNFF